MKRREFIRLTAPVAALPFIWNGFSLTAYGRSRFSDALLKTTTDTDRVFVLVQLIGGNDGLNTVIPLDQYSAYQAARSNIAIPEATLQATKLSDATALHPAMTHLKSLFDEQKLAVVQGVSYPNPNLSHFRATDIWLTAADYDQYLESGWLGRYVDEEFPGYPDGFPTEAMPDPVAIQISSVVSNALQGVTGSAGTAITNPNGSYLSPGESGQPPNTFAGAQVAYILGVQSQTQQYSTVVKAAYNNAQNKSTLYPASGQNTLADQLAIVARLIAGGLKTRIYVVNIGGFDTHSSQVTNSDATTGTHAALLGKLSLAIGAFMDDVNLLGVMDRVVGMTFSEFGRRIKSNASYGTDHGTSEPMFIFGSKINGGLYGKNPTLPANATVNDNLSMQYDFRQIYSSVLAQWFNVGTDELTSVLWQQFDALPIFDSITGLRNTSAPGEFQLYQNYPNPFNPSTTINYQLPAESDVTVKVFDALGKKIETLVNKHQNAGLHAVEFDARGLASGVYFYQIEAGILRDVKKMIYAK
ncbi:MAG: DUF1501 domain-containing protein [Bacteroidota bacterium]|nr:DUF1501 domain-containing protein [Bacteroidota bacterium]